jgi:two-component system chemotaxis response regulator CheY
VTYPKTILLTDDEPHIRKFLALVLRQFDNPRILEAANGAEAIELYKLHQPDLVLLDVNMPVLDGMQALAQIRAFDSEAIVVMLTSLANRQTVEACVRLGAVDYIRKDMPRDEMKARFESIIAECFGAEDPV